MEKLVEKMAKLAFEADRNIIGESFIIQADNNLSAKLGVIFGATEAYNINDNFLDGFFGAIGDLKTEYYLPPHTAGRGVEKRFEEAISRANRRIFSAISESVEEVDLRNISAAIGLWHDHHVYLSAIGRVRALFFRRKKNGELLIIDILSDTDENRLRPEPEKVFANIISGEVARQDALLLLNEEFLGLFAQKELGEIVLNNNAATATQIINNLLQEKIAKSNFYAVVIAPEIETTITAGMEKKSTARAVLSDRPQPLPASTASKTIGQRVSNETETPIKPKRTIPTQQSIDQLLFTQVKTEKYLTPSLLPPWRKVLVVFFSGLGKVLSYLAKKIKKTALSNGRTISGWFKSKKSKNISPTSKNGDTKEIMPVEEKIDETLIVGSDNYNNESGTIFPAETVTEETINDDEIQTVDAADDALPPKYYSGKIAAKINNWLNAQIQKFLTLKKTQQVVLIAGLILVFLFSQSIVMIGRSADNSQTAASNNSLTKQIETQLDNAEAQNIFNDEAGALTSLKKAKELFAQIPERRLNKSLRSELQAKIEKTAGLLQKIKYLDNPTVNADFSSSQGVNTVGLAKTGKVFWVYDNAAKNLLRFDTASGKLAVVTTSLPIIKKLSALDDKNLILAAENSYYKYTISTRAENKTTISKDWFQLKLPSVASPLVDPPLASSTIDMSLMSDNSLMFFLDGGNGRIVVLDKNGVLKRQYYSAALKGAGAFAASARDKKIWFFNGNKVYQLDLDF